MVGTYRMREQDWIVSRNDGNLSLDQTNLDLARLKAQPDDSFIRRTTTTRDWYSKPKPAR